MRLGKMLVKRSPGHSKMSSASSMALMTATSRCSSFATRSSVSLRRRFFPARFFFGGLYSAYVVFYFKSASSGPTLLFLGVLVIQVNTQQILPLRDFYALILICVEDMDGLC